MTQWPVLIVAIPLLSALFVTAFGYKNKAIAYPISVLALLGSSIAAIKTAMAVALSGPQSYWLSGWAPPYGIEYRIDHLNALLLVVVAVSAFLAAVFSKNSVQKELDDKITTFYTLFLLLTTGLLGISITGDAFNLYVLLEIAALTSYGLIALGKGRAYFATFNYVMMGTIGACFYLLGVGYLFIKTGSLNMVDMSQILQGMLTSHAVLVAFIFILVGVLVKMAFFPVHSWLPNAYTYAPTATSCLVAPLMTKVSVYMLVRLMLTVFSADFVYRVLQWQTPMIWLSIGSIVAGSVYALGQTNIKRMLTYLIVAEMGYMVGGIWLGNAMGLTGAIYHIIGDAVMTLCLFMVVGSIIYKQGNAQFESLKGAFQKMPITMSVFLVGAFSMIGIPPTAGFFSKWYLISGAYQAGQWPFIVALIFSSLVNAVLFFRLIEVAFFQATPDEAPGKHPKTFKMAEAPLTMIIPMVTTAVAILALGIGSNWIITTFISQILPKGLM